MDEAIEKFFIDKKKSSEEWLKGVSKKASQLSGATHPPKFSHPDAKASAVNASSNERPDGFLRTGNCKCELDIIGNAAAFDVFKFLNVTLRDGKPLWEHIEKRDPEVLKFFESNGIDSEELVNELLAIRNRGEATKSSPKVKQVYFPVEENYHLLSVLSPSGIMLKLKKKIVDVLFSEESKQEREKYRKGEFGKHGFSRLPNLTLVGYGGTKTQNISTLNSSSGGKFYLLPSLPPVLQERDFRLPRFDFFKESIWVNSFKNEFQWFHQILKQDRNNYSVRESRDRAIYQIVDRVIDHVWSIREHSEGWSEGTRYSNLPRSQKILLDNLHREERCSSDEWTKEVLESFSRWIIFSYREVFDRDAVLLGDVELRHINQVLKGCGEAIR